METYLAFALGLSAAAAPVAAEATGGVSFWDVAAIVGALLLVALNGFFVAAEFALVKVRPTRIDELAARGGGAARTAKHAITHLDAYLSATQLGITLASLGLGWLGEPAFGRLVAPLVHYLGIPDSALRLAEVALAFLIITFLHIVFGELAPKSLAIQRPQAVALAVAWPMALFHTLFRLPIIVLNGAAGLVLRAFGIEPAHEAEMAHSPEEIGMIVLSSEASGAMGADEAAMARNAIVIGDRDARDVMVPRVDVAFLSTAWTLEENLERVHEAGFTRFPLADPDVDRIIGMIHIKDLLAIGNRSGAVIADARRDILVVPETKPLDSLLREFQSSRIHLAVVVDEYGGTAGIVTLEDVLEEIVGDIQDEHQDEQPEVEQLDENSFRVDGALTLADLERNLGIELPDEEAETVAGYMQWRLGAVPEAGQSVTAEGYTLTVETMEGRRVRAVVITRGTPAETETAAA